MGDVGCRMWGKMWWWWVRPFDNIIFLGLKLGTCQGLVTGAPLEVAVESNGAGRWWWVQRSGRFGAQSSKSRRWGSVMGAPLEMAVVNNGSGGGCCRSIMRAV
jgi:hypothetical protein